MRLKEGTERARHILILTAHVHFLCTAAVVVDNTNRAYRFVESVNVDVIVWQWRTMLKILTINDQLRKQTLFCAHIRGRICRRCLNSLSSTAKTNKFKCLMCVPKLTECSVAAAAAGSMSTNTDEDDFFTRRRDGDATPAHAVDPLNQYLQLASTSDDTLCIATWPELKELFIKLNTPLPASAAAERLFSCAGLAMNSRRSKMTDELFENLVLMRKNKGFKPL